MKIHKTETPLINKKFTIMEKEIVIENKENDSYKLILKLEIDEDDEKLLKNRLNLLALSTKLNDEQSEILETLFGYYWYKKCEINVLKQDE